MLILVNLIALPNNLDVSCSERVRQRHLFVIANFAGGSILLTFAGGRKNPLDQRARVLVTLLHLDVIQSSDRKQERP